MGTKHRNLRNKSKMSGSGSSEDFRFRCKADGGPILRSRFRSCSVSGSVPLPRCPIAISFWLYLEDFPIISAAVSVPRVK